jgi:hypothetical protein
MLHFSDSKTMAKTLRKALAERQIDISHSDSLELVARQFGFANWNMLSARIEMDQKAPTLPPGWMPTGLGRANLYRVGVDPDFPGAVKVEAIDRSRPVDADAFGGLMQSILADDYHGKTVRVRAELRGRGVERGAIWMRVDPAAGRPPIAFDNMMERRRNGPIRGDVNWTERSIVLAVPDTAVSIHYGILLAGDGELWARKFSVEEVDPAEVAVTAQPMPRKPNNLEFRAE